MSRRMNEVEFAGVAGRTRRAQRASRPLVAAFAVACVVASGLIAPVVGQTPSMPGESGAVPVPPQPGRIQRVPVEVTPPVFVAEPASGEPPAAHAQQVTQPDPVGSSAVEMSEDKTLIDEDAAASEAAAPAESAAAPIAAGEGAAEDAAGTVDTLEPVLGEDRELFTALMAAEFALQDGRVESAAKHYARAALISDDPKIAEQSARIALQAGRSDLAAQSLKRWRELSPAADGGVEAAEAGLALAGGDVAAATKALAPLLAGGEDARRSMVQTLLAPGSRPHLGAALDALAKGAAAQDADSLVLLSQVADQVKDRERTLAFADAAIDTAPEDAAARVWRAHLRFSANDIKGGRADMDRALAMGDDKPALRFNYAAMLSNAGEHAAADSLLRDQPVSDAVLAARGAYAARANDDGRLREVYAALRKLEEPHPTARLELLANLAELLDLNEDALRWYGAIGATDPRFLASQLRIAILKNGMGRQEEALAMVRDLRAAGIDEPERLAESYLLEAEILRSDSKPEQVLAIYDQAIRLLPEQGQLGYARAVYLESIGRIDEAVADLRAMLAKSPDDADALNALGYTLADRTDRHEEALGLIERALEQKPNEPAIIDSLGWVLFRLGRNEEALAHLRRAWSMQPDPEVGAHFGELLWVTGDKAEARRIWAAAADREEDNKVLAETRRRLEK